MDIDLAQKPTLAVNLRVVAGFVAVLSAAGVGFSIFRGTGTVLQLSLGCVSAVAWGSLAFFGNKPGWSRKTTLAAFVLLVALTACKLAGAVV